MWLGAWEGGGRGADLLEGLGLNRCRNAKLRWRAALVYDQAREEDWQVNERGQEETPRVCLPPLLVPGEKTASE